MGISGREKWEGPVVQPEEGSSAVRALAEHLLFGLGDTGKLDARLILRNLADAVDAITKVASAVTMPRVLASVYQGDYHTGVDTWFAVRSSLTQAANGLRVLGAGFVDGRQVLLPEDMTAVPEAAALRAGSVERTHPAASIGTK